MRASVGHGLRASARHRRGQTIVIALLVLLLLAFVGGLFATIVTRNLANAGRSNRVQSADYYAEAGIRFANDQLTTSLDGADWRPPLQNKLGDGTNGTVDARPKDPRGLARYTAIAASLPAVATNDPDRDYLLQGFTRYNIGGGRYLLRVTYDPAGLNNQDNTSTTANTAYADPRARYLKIEAVGREGAIDSNDPTTYNTASKTQLNATLVQYKAIGITDYARFETNPENRSDVMALGVSSQYSATGGSGAAGSNGSIVTPGVFDFNTNNNNNTNTMALSQYPIVTTYGALDAFLTSGTGLIANPTAGSGQAAPTGYTLTPGGGSIHVNGSVRFFGANNIYLNNAQAPTPTAGNTNASIKGLFGETLEVAGNLLLDNYNPANALTTGQDAAVQTFVNADTTANASFVYPSNDNANRFTTLGGAVRDGSGGNDAAGNPRSVNRLDPPTLDTVNPVTNLPRYADLAKNSSPRATEASAANATQTPYGTGSAAYGYGQSVYIDNTTDVQSESSSIIGGHTLVDEWLHRAGADNGAGSKSGWTASFYRPPGVDIVLGRQQVAFPATGGGTTSASFFGVRMTRSDVDGAGSLIGWKDPTGNPISGVTPDGNTQSTMTVSYKSLNASNDLTAAAANPVNPSNDVVIYAEGNVRVHGVVSADSHDTSDPTTYAGGATGSANDDDHLPRHVTIVTGGTAYIDGSLLRGNPESSITVLAHDYVCVNTTQFLAGTISDRTPAGTSPPGAYTGDPSLRALDFGASDEVLLQEFTLATATPSSTDEHLYISGGPSGPGATAFDVDLLDASTGYSLNGTNQGAFSDANLTQFTPASTGTANVPFFTSIDSTGFTQPNFFTTQTGLLRTTFDLGTPPTSITPSNPLQLAIRRDQGSDGTPSTQDFLLERAAILPMDIKIEAVLFAQTRSFFVIPGDWFNSSSDDNVQSYATANANGTTPKRPGIDATRSDENRFPFYGQPIDMKIVIDGAVSEARPADITAQSAWMAKWGWIPQYRGGLVNSTPTTETTGRPSFGTGNPLGVGLQIIYNPLAGFPYYQDSTASPAVIGHYLRTDIYGRPLPYAPKLPVCAGLLYAGQNTGESLLQ